jgi:hypothetical protein
MRRRRPAHELRIAVDCLPLVTRKAMLEGVESNRIIVGAYVDRQGGVCPMLAAHRNGGRTSLASFAHAWDRYTKAGGRARPATERELRTLTVMLEASIALAEQGDGELGATVAEHRALVEPRERRRPRRLRDSGERDRTRELRGSPGWAWLRPVRRLDEYERAVRELEELGRKRSEREREREPV